MKMAKSKNNIITHGLSGKVGDLLVFSQRNGKTIVSKVPTRKAELSDKQKQQISKFQEAVLYAKNALKDPITKEMYELQASKKQGLSSYNVAVADLMNAPKIEEINLTEYTGKKGDKIKIKAIDDFKVVEVKVLIYNADGSLLEEGDAKEEGLYWVYTAKENNADLSGEEPQISQTIYQKKSNYYKFQQHPKQ